MSLSGKKIVFSGFRNQSLKDRIESDGGKVMSAISKLTNILVVKDLESAASKVAEAKQRGAVVMTLDAFVSNYFPNNNSSQYNTKKKLKANAVLKKSASYYEVPSDTPKTVNDAERWLQSNEKKSIRLQHGDVVNFSGDRFMEAFIVMENGSGMRLVDNPDYGGSGYLSIPPEVTKTMDDAVKYYRPLAKKVNSVFHGFEAIALGPTDRIRQKIFTKSSALSADALMIYWVNDDDDDEPAVEVRYQGKKKAFSLKTKQHDIESYFAKALSTTQSMYVRFLINVDILDTQYAVQSSKLIPPTVHSDLISSIKLPDDVEIKRFRQNVYEIKFPVTKYHDVLEVVENMKYTLSR